MSGTETHRISRSPLRPLAGIILSAATLAGCGGGGKGPAVISATVVDSTGHPVPGALARLELANDAIAVETTADSTGGLELRFGATGVAPASFVVGPGSEPAGRVRAPLLLEPGGRVHLDVRIGGNAAEMDYPADGGRMARWGRAVSLRETIQRRWLAAYSAWVQGDQRTPISIRAFDPSSIRSARCSVASATQRCALPSGSRACGPGSREFPFPPIPPRWS